MFGDLKDIFEGIFVGDNTLCLEDGAGSLFFEEGDGIGDGSNIVNLASEISLGCIDGVGESRKIGRASCRERV